MAISAWIYIALTAMKRGNEALKASSLQFLSIVKRFIAVNFYGKTSSNASSPLLLKRNSSLNASSPLLFKVTLPSTGYDTIAKESSLWPNTRQFFLYKFVSAFQVCRSNIEITISWLLFC
jgi:hypothetical protein